MRRLWDGVPRGVCVAVVGQALVLGYGGVVHVAQVVGGGWPPYAWAPGWLAGYFTLLTVVDFFVAGLLVGRRVAGLWLAVLVFATDAAANWYATYRLVDGGMVARVAQGVISLLAVGSVVVAWRAWPWVAGRTTHSE